VQPRTRRESAGLARDDEAVTEPSQTDTETVSARPPPAKRLTENEVQEQLRRVFRQTARQSQEIGMLVGADLGPGSALVGDDRASNPYKVSQSALRALSIATEHLHAFEALIVEAGYLHLSAPFTLIRASIETASSAVWLLEPTSRSERVLRSLRVGVGDAIDGDRVATELGLPVNRPLAERRAQVDTLARRVGHVGVVRPATSTEIVRAASAAAGSALDVLAAWRTCSGFAHGRVWAMLSVLDREEQLPGSSSGDVLLKVTSSLDRVLWPAWAASDVIEHGLDRYRLLSASPYEAR
jgi:hypothetical protein